MVFVVGLLVLRFTFVVLTLVVLFSVVPVLLLASVLVALWILMLLFTPLTLLFDDKRI